MADTIWIAATLIAWSPVSCSPAAGSLGMPGRLGMAGRCGRLLEILGSSGRATFAILGSAQVPSIWNSWVAALDSGLLSTHCARKVPRPMAGLIAVATSAAVPALISGTTTTRRFCVSWTMSAEPSISAAAFTPFICRLLVLAVPFAILASPRMKSKAKPWLNTSRKSSVSRRGSACRLSTPSSLARPGSALRNWPDSTFTPSWPPRLG